MNQITEELREVAGAVLEVQLDTSEFRIVLYKRHPVLNRRIKVVFQYGGYALGGQQRSRFIRCQPSVNDFPERGDFNRLYKDFISL